MAMIQPRNEFQSKSRSLYVYLSEHFLSSEKSSSSKIQLPPLDRSETSQRTKKKRRVYRTSLYHSNSTPYTVNNLPELTARGTKPEMYRLTKQEEMFYSRSIHQPAPPPTSPVDDPIEQLILNLYQDESSDEEHPIPYRLPALKRTKQRKHINVYLPTSSTTSTTSTRIASQY